MSLWNFITDFGDTAVTLPLWALMVAFLAFAGEKRAAACLTLAVALCGLTIGLAKLALQSCGRPLLSIDLVTPSGHAALATVVFGSFAYLLSRGAPAERRWIFAAGAVIIILCIAVSRIALAVHSTTEVVAGLCIGLSALAIFGRLAGPLLEHQSILWLCVPAAVLIAVFHGSRLPVEEIVQSLIHLIRYSVPACA
jgi:membrane-associated phospholipid phosphatase